MYGACLSSAGAKPSFREKPMPPRHRFLEPIHNVKEGQQPHASAAVAAKIWSSYLEKNVTGPKAGGASRDRTDDLKLAKLALSQLSYGPDGAPNIANMAHIDGGPSRS